MLKKLITIFISFFFYCNIAVSENLKIVYVDIEKIINQSVAGKNITEKIKDLNSKNISKFKKKEQELVELEKKIIKKKNVISEEDFNTQVKELNSNVVNFKKEINDTKIKIDRSRLEATQKILEVLNPILSEYSAKNSISLIIQKKNIVIGKTELDITSQILDLVNLKIKSVNFN
jgi:outer membrane protein